MSLLRLQPAAQRWTLPGQANLPLRLLPLPLYPDGNRHYYPEHIKEQAIDIYGEGMAVAAINRVLEVNLGTVYEWIKKSGGP